MKKFALFVGTGTIYLLLLIFAIFSHPTYGAQISLIDEMGTASTFFKFRTENTCFINVNGELAVMDFTNPSNVNIGPRSGGTCSTKIKAFDTFGNYIYAKTSNTGGGYTSFKIFDASTPDKISLLNSVGSFRSSPNVYDISTDGHFLAVGEKDNTIKIYTIDDPAAPVFQYDIDTGGAARFILRDGCLLISTISGTVDYDLRTGNPPQRVWVTTDVRTNTGLLYSGNTLFLTQFDVIYILDVSDFSSPKLLGKYRSPQYTTFSSLTVVGNKLIAADGQNGFQLISIEDPTVPVFLQMVKPEGVDNVGSVYASGDTLLVSNALKGLYVYDVSTITTPHLLMEIPLMDGSAGMALLSGNVVVAGSSKSYIVSFSESSGFKVLSNIEANGLLCSAGDGKIFLAAKDDLNYFVLVYDATDPHAPELKAKIPLDSRPVVMEYGGDHLLLGLYDQTFHAFSVADPGNPSEVTHFKAENSINSLFLHNTTLFMGVRDSGLDIYDASDWHNLTSIGHYNRSGIIGHSWLYKNRLLVDVSGNLDVLDISDLSQPKRLNTHSLYIGGNSVLMGNQLFSRGAYCGFLSFDLSDLSEIPDPEYFSTNGGVSSLLVRDSILFETVGGYLRAYAVQGTGDSVSLSVVSDGNGLVSPQTTQQIPVGSTATISAFPSDGYRFNKWYGDIDSTENPLILTLTKETTVHAEFVSNTVPIQVSVGTGEGTTDPNGTIDAVVGSWISIHAVPDEKGEFSGWTGTFTSNQNPISFIVKEPVNLVANFLAVQHTVRTQVWGGKGTIEPSSLLHVDHGSTVTLKAIPDNGYQFLQWEGDINSSENPVQITVTDNLNIGARFIPMSADFVTLSTSVVRGEGGRVIPQGNAKYLPGSEVCLKAIPEPGYGFDQWSGDVSGHENPKIITVNANTNAFANFKKIQSLDTGMMYREVSKWGEGESNCMIKKGDYMYIGTDGGIEIVDLRDMTKPTCFRPFQVSGNVTHLKFVNGILIAVLEDNSIISLNVDVPFSPEILSQVKLEYVQFMTILENGAIVCGSYPNYRISVLKLLASGQLEEVSQFYVGSAPQKCICSLDNTVILGGNSTIQEYDLTDPQNPVQLDDKYVDGSLLGMNENGTSAVEGDNVIRLVDFSVSGTPVAASEISVYAYVASARFSGHYLSISFYNGRSALYDVTDIRQPVLVDGRKEDSEVRDAIVEGSTLFQLSAREGLAAYTINRSLILSDLEEKYIGSRTSVIDEDTLYLISQSTYYSSDYKLEVWDISDPQHPVLATTRNLGINSIEDLKLEGSFLHVLGSLDWYIFDISNPLSPNLFQKVGVANISPSSIFWHDNLYMVCGYNTAFFKWDHSSSSVSLVATDDNIDTAKGALYYPYFYSQDQEGIRIYDISYPAAMIEVGFIPFYTLTKTKNSELSPLIVQGNRLYAYRYGSGLSIFDLTDPACPKVIGYWNHLNLWDADFPFVVQALSSSRIAVPCDGGCQILDVSDSSNIRVTDSLAVPNKTVLNFFVNGTQKFVLYKTSTSTNPTMVFLAICNDNSQWEPVHISFNSGDRYALDQSGGSLYTSDGNANFETLDVSNTCRISRTKKIPLRLFKGNSVPYTASHITGIATGQGVTAVGTSGLGGILLDSTDVRNPFPVSVFSNNSIQKVKLADGLFVIRDEQENNSIWDFSNPLAPQNIYDNSDGVMNGTIVFVRDNYVMTMMSGSELSLINIDDPSAPRKKSSFQLEPDEILVSATMSETRAYLLTQTTGRNAFVIHTYSFDLFNNALGSLELAAGEVPTGIRYANSRLLLPEENGLLEAVLDVKGIPTEMKRVWKGQCLQDIVTKNDLIYGVSGKEGSVHILQSSDLLIPHIAWSDTWHSYLVIHNLTTDEKKPTVETYIEGETVPQTLTVGPLATQIIPLKKGGCARLDLHMDGIIAKELFVNKTQGGIAEFLLGYPARERLDMVLPWYMKDSLTWNGVALMNPNHLPVNINMIAYNPDGEVSGQCSRTIEPSSRLVDYVSSFFPDLVDTPISRLQIEASEPITGLNISGWENERLLFTPSTGASVDNRMLFVPHIASEWDFWNNYLIFDNTENKEQSCDLWLISPDGTSNNFSVTVSANASKIINLNDYKSDSPQCGFVFIPSGNLLVRQSFQSKVYGGTAEFFLSDHASRNIEFLFPVNLAFSLTWRGLAVFNTSKKEAHVTLKAYSNGIVVDSQEFLLPPWSRTADILGNIFQGESSDEIDRVSASSDQPITGINISGNGQKQLLFTQSINAESGLNSN